MENENGVDQNKNLMNPDEQNYMQQFNYIPPKNFLDPQNNQFMQDQNLQNNYPYPIQSQENQDNIPIGDRSNDKSEGTEEKKNQKTLKRRSKSEVEGRNHQCKFCKKSYLSYPALYTHCKLKHNTNNSSGRGRGRPKKEQNENEIEKSTYNPNNLSFFSKEERTGHIESSEINKCIEIAFKEIYSEEFKNKIKEMSDMKFYESVNDHPFLNRFLQDVHDTSKNAINEHEIADIVLIDYLNKMSMFCNENYYIKLIKFVTLFREHVNIYNSRIDKVKYGEEEYTTKNDAEDVPDCSNEFITDFLHPEGSENNFGFSKEESIDLTQNLCYWMYENNFTCSKLSLINTEK